MSPADPAPFPGAAPILQFPANYPPPPYAPPNPMVRVRHEFPLAVLELGRLLSYGMIAVGGEWGTLSEIGLAGKLGRPVVGLAGWDVRGVEQARDPADAVALLLDRLGGGPPGSGQPARSNAG